MNFEIITRETACRIPLVVHGPHSSTNIPPDIRQALCLDDHELQCELLCMTDWYTDRLFDEVVELGGTLFVNLVSRLIVDPERFPGKVFASSKTGHSLEPMCRSSIGAQTHACVL